MSFFLHHGFSIQKKVTMITLMQLITPNNERKQAQKRSQINQNAHIFTRVEWHHRENRGISPETIRQQVYNFSSRSKC